MHKVFIAFVVSFIITGCSTLSIQTDYDREFDFTLLSNFSVLYTKKDDGYNFTRSRINKTITKYFQEKGYSATSKEKADFYVLFHFNVKTIREIETTYDTMMIRPRAYYKRGNKVAFMNSPYLFPLFTDPFVTTTTHTYEYEEGQLNLEILDVKTNTIVWQGRVVDDLSDISKQEQIDKIVDKLFEDLFYKK